MEKSKIDRINALAKKAKAIGLTERENRRARRFAQGVSGRYARGLQTAARQHLCPDCGRRKDPLCRVREAL